MDNLAIIPARGGSKRIPRKNIREFLGKPIISYSITAAIESGLFSEVMVSTDDEEIAEIALKYGAKVPFMRTKENADDFATTLDVVKEVLTMYHKMWGKDFSAACCIYPTAPLLNLQYLKEGYRLLMDNQYSSVFPVVEFSFPIWRGLEFVNGKIRSVWPEHKQKRSQDLPKVFHDAGQWYWFVPNKIDDSLYTENSSSVILEEEYVQDIDTFSDWKIAEIKYLNWKSDSHK
jgi:pseudaminic acid cytidylyltransferase